MSASMPPNLSSYSGVSSSEVPVTGTGAAPPAVSVPVVTTPAASTASPAMSRRCKVWGVPFDCVTLSESLDRIGELVSAGKPSYVITANLNYVMLHWERPEMHAVTRDAAMIVADGQPIVWRSRLGGTKLPDRVAGSEMIFELAERAADNSWRIYFLGGEPGVAQACADRLQTRYGGLQVAGVESPPFRSLTPEEQAEQDERIRSACTDILLVAFGQPKGEKWIHQNYQRLGVPVSIQLGASFDFIAGTARRAPEIWQRFGMEWLYRMASDPKRLVPRYIANAAFLVQALVTDWCNKVRSWGMWDSTPGTHPRSDRRQRDRQ